MATKRSASWYFAVAAGCASFAFLIVLPIAFFAGLAFLDPTWVDPEAPWTDWSCYAVGDLDGDGAQDLCISSRFDPSTSEDAHTSWILSGASEAPRMSLRIASAEANARHQSVHKYARSWHSVTGAGDHDGDGFGDVSIEWSHELVDHQQIRSGRDGSLLAASQQDDDMKFPHPRVPAGDFDRDGKADWLERMDGDELEGVPTKVVVLSGANGTQLLAISEPVKPSPYEGYPNAIDATNFGHDLCGLGDIDGDAVPDIAIADSWEDTAATNTGRVYFHSGKDGRLLFSIAGPERTWLGSPLNAVGDLDGDGIADLSAGVHGGPDRLLSGKSGTTIRTTEPLRRVLSAGDVDDDGTTDFIGRRAEWHPEGVEFEELEIHSGKDWSLLRTMRAEMMGCTSVYFECVGDFTGDGQVDFIVVGDRTLERGGGGWRPAFGFVSVFSGADGTLVRRYDRETLAELDARDFPRIVIPEDD